jgi:transcriptional regulator with XRE-family HTH domain
MPEHTDSVGARIRQWRHTRLLSAQQLADKVHISANYLLKIESGRRTASRRVLLDLARALRVGIEVLDGQPEYGEPEQQEGVHAVMPELRRILLCYDQPDDLENAPRPLVVLGAEVDQVSAMRRDTLYATMGPLLAPLITELSHVALGATDEGEERRAFAHLALAYRAVNSLAHKLGYHDMSSTAIERLRWAASRAGDPLLEVMAEHLRLGALLRSGAYGQASRLIAQMEARLARIAGGRWDDTSRAALGAVRLKEVMVRARLGDVEGAMRMVEDAEEIAAASGGRDGVYYESTFGPTNIRIHEVAALVDIGDTAAAVRRVREWGREQGRELWTPPRGTAPERSSHHHIDFAQAQLAEGDRAGAFVSLQEARRIAPQHTRFRPQARETVATLIRLERDAPETLAGLARWMGQ